MFATLLIVFSVLGGLSAIADRILTDEQKDVLRITVPVQKLNEGVEAMAMTFEKSESGCNLIIAWDNIKASLPISLK